MTCNCGSPNLQGIVHGDTMCYVSLGTGIIAMNSNDDPGTRYALVAPIETNLYGSLPALDENLLDKTTQFMELAGQLSDPSFPTDKMDDLRLLRRNLLHEEVREYRLGEDGNDIVETVDGLLDIIVIAWGTLLAYVGETKAKAAASEVARSNLSKVDGSLGPVQFREDGKVIKPAGWTPPNIAGALE